MAVSSCALKHILKCKMERKTYLLLLFFPSPHSFHLTVSGTAPGCLRCSVSRLVLCDSVAFYFVTSELSRLPKRRVQKFCDMIILLLWAHFPLDLTWETCQKQLGTFILEFCLKGQTGNEFNDLIIHGIHLVFFFLFFFFLKQTFQVSTIRSVYSRQQLTF